MRLPNPRDGLERWLRQAGVSRSAAVESADVLAERGWQPEGATGALSDLRGLSDLSILLAQRKLGEEAVRRAWETGGGDGDAAASPGKRRRQSLAEARESAAAGASTRELQRYDAPTVEAAEKHRASLLFEGGRNTIHDSEPLGEMGVGVELFFKALRVSLWAMVGMTLCYAPGLVLHRAGNDGYALSTPKVVAAGDLGLVRYGLGNEGLDRDAIAQRRGRCDCATVDQRVADAVGCLDEGGGVDCRCSDKGVDKARFCDAWRRLRVRGRSVGDAAVANVVSLSALGACLVLVVAAGSFDASLARVVKRRRTRQAEPADYTVVVRGLPPGREKGAKLAYFKPLLSRSLSTRFG